MWTGNTNEKFEMWIPNPFDQTISMLKLSQSMISNENAKTTIHEHRSPNFRLHSIYVLPGNVSSVKKKEIWTPKTIWEANQTIISGF